MSIKLILKAIAGFLNPWGSVFDSISEYGLDLLNGAIKKIDPTKKEKIQAALNTAKKVLAILRSVSWLCPTKWQTAYGETIEAAEAVEASLSDLTLTQDELSKIILEFNEAVEAWKAPDDETCVDCDGCCEKGID